MKKLIIFLLYLFPIDAFAWSLTCNTAGQALQFDPTTGWQCVMPIAQKSEIYTATTGFSHTIADGITISIINSAILLLTGTITLPANPADGQPLTLEAPHGLTAATITANTGQSISGTAITTMTANMPYRIKYSGVNSTWYPN